MSSSPCSFTRNLLCLYGKKLQQPASHLLPLATLSHVGSLCFCFPCPNQLLQSLRNLSEGGALRRIAMPTRLHASEGTGP